MTARPAISTGVTAPWSVPPLAFSLSRRPNSEKNQDHDSLVALARFQAVEEPGQGFPHRLQELLMGIELAGMSIETILGRIVDPARRVGLDEAPDRLQPALERLGIA